MSRRPRASRWALLFCAAALLSFATAAGAREVAGVDLPEVLKVEGTSLELNGAGLRERLYFDVYVVGLYLEKPTRDARVAIRSDQVKHVVIVMRRDVDPDDFAGALKEGIQKNSAEALPTLSRRLARLERAIPRLTEGMLLSFTYRPGEGTRFRAEGTELTIEGKDFVDALLLVWLGPNPVSGDLKRDLLRGPP